MMFIDPVKFTIYIFVVGHVTFPALSTITYVFPRFRPVLAARFSVYLWPLSCDWLFRSLRAVAIGSPLGDQSLSSHKHSRPQTLRSFWPAAGIERSGSNHFKITKEITEFCPSGFTQSASMAHAWNGCSQSSWFLPQASRIVGSGDENVSQLS